jgi:hypothetical protein
METPLRAMCALAETESILSVAMPRIGTGYGGRWWELVVADWPGRCATLVNVAHREHTDEYDVGGPVSRWRR